MERIKWSKEHGHDIYFGNHHKSRSERGECKPQDKLKCHICGSNTHKCSCHRDCPFNKHSLLCTEKKGHSKSVDDVYMFTSDSDKQVSDADMYNIGSLYGASSDSCTSKESVGTVCMCGAERRGHTLFPPPAVQWYLPCPELYSQNMPPTIVSHLPPQESKSPR